MRSAARRRTHQAHTLGEAPTAASGTRPSDYSRAWSRVAYISDDARCETSALPSALPRIECDLGTPAQGESRTVRMVTAVTATDGQPIRSDARISGANVDPEPANNPDAAQTPVAPIAAPPSPPAPPSQPPTEQKKQKKQKKKKAAPRLVSTKRSGTAIARLGSVINYRITVVNRGERPARKVIVMRPRAPSAASG